MANTAYISAGLPVAKNSGQSPTVGVNTAYLSAGLPAAPIFSSTLTSSIGSITSYSISTVTNLYNQIGGKGIRRRSYSQRPNDFTIDNTHTLARGLVFAGLSPGGMVGSTRYHDSSVYGNHGTLTNMDPATDWVFDPTLGRYAVNASTTTKMVVGNTPRFGSYGTVSCWFRSTGTPASFGKFFLIGTGEVQLYRNDANTSIVLAINGTNQIFIVPNLWNGIQHSIIAQWAPNWRRVIIDGVPITASTTAYTFPSLSASWYLGNQAAGDRVIGGLLGDVIGYDRIISDAEIQQLADPSNVLLSGLIRPPKRTVFKSAVSNFPTTQYTRLSLCALPTRPYKGFIAKTQYTPPIIVLTRYFTPLQLFQNTI